MLLATFLVEPEAVALERTLEDHPDLEVEAERIAAHSTSWTMPCLWIAAGDGDIDAEALLSDPTVNEVVETADFDGELYCNLEWTDEVIERISTYVDEGGSILEAYADASGWTLQIRFTARDQFDRFREVLSENGCSFELLDLRESGAPRQSYGDLTPEQYEVLVTAMERGYFRVPREITLRELAADFDKSHQAVSDLLRRGIEKLVDAVLTTPVEANWKDEITGKST